MGKARGGVGRVQGRRGVLGGDLHRLTCLVDNRTMFPALKNNAAAGYKGPVKITPFDRCIVDGLKLEELVSPLSGRSIHNDIDP